MQALPVRLAPGADLRAALEAIARSQFPEGVFVVCGIGSLVDPRLRLAGQTEETCYRGPWEVLTLSGTITGQGAHLHMSIAAESGHVAGGHVVYGNAVRTTVELLLAPPGPWRMSRAVDAATGFHELVVAPSPGADRDR